MESVLLKEPRPAADTAADTDTTANANAPVATVITADPPPPPGAAIPPAHLEKACAAAILLLACWPLSLMLHAMATTSLWGDEIYSIYRFSGKGAAHVFTDYAKPNNHIFFNLLNALTPGAGSYDPPRARIWSFAAVLAGLTWTVCFFAKRRLFLEGALLIAFMALNRPTLDLVLQARGYGILHTCALGCMFLAVGVLESPKTMKLVCIGALVTIGTWTVPSFVFFGESLLVLLWIASRRKEVLTCAVATFLAIALLHVPVLRQMLDVSTNYAKNWGSPAADKAALGVSVLEHVLAGPTWIAAGAWLAAMLVPFWFRAEPPAVGRALRLGAIATAVFFMACLVVQTPPARTMAFTTAACGMSLAVLAGALLRGVRREPVRRTATVAVAVVLAAFSVGQALRFSFVPIDNWSEVAATIRRLAPPGTPVHVMGEGYLLRLHLPGAEYPSPGEVDASLFRAGGVWVVDARIDVPEALRFRAADLAAEGGVDLDVPQQRGGFQRISYVPRK